jgi:hypothetical protein
MALSSNSVQKAWSILNTINPKANNSFIESYDEENPLKEDAIIGISPKSDGGWENVFINVKDITPEQEAIFEQRKSEVFNSSFKRNEENGITRLGWF